MNHQGRSRKKFEEIQQKLKKGEDFALFPFLPKSHLSARGGTPKAGIWDTSAADKW